MPIYPFVTQATALNVRLHVRAYVRYVFRWKWCVYEKGLYNDSLLQAFTNTNLSFTILFNLVYLHCRLNHMKAWVLGVVHVLASYVVRRIICLSTFINFFVGRYRRMGSLSISSRTHAAACSNTCVLCYNGWLHALVLILYLALSILSECYTVNCLHVQSGSAIVLGLRWALLVY